MVHKKIELVMQLYYFFRYRATTKWEKGLVSIIKCSLSQWVLQRRVEYFSHPLEWLHRSDVRAAGDHGFETTIALFHNSFQLKW